MRIGWGETDKPFPTAVGAGRKRLVFLSVKPGSEGAVWGLGEKGEDSHKLPPRVAEEGRTVKIWFTFPILFLFCALKSLDI